MDDRKLHVLLTVLRLGSFSAAVKELNCTQSAVTQMMNSLEDELGLKVLRRGHRGVALTPAGERLLPWLADAEKALRRVALEATRLAAGEEVTIRIGAFSSICNTWLPDVIDGYQRRRGNVRFDIRTDTRHLAEWLRGGVIDLALGDEERCGGEGWQALMDDPFFAVMPAALASAKQQAVTLDELAAFPFVASPFYAAPTATFRPRRRIDMTSNDDTSLLQMVARGLGVTVMPSLCLHEIPRGVVLKALAPAFKRVIGVALPARPTPAAADFASFLRKRCEEQLAPFRSFASAPAGGKNPA